MSRHAFGQFWASFNSTEDLCNFAYNDILYNCVLSALWQHFGKEPHMGCDIQVSTYFFFLERNMFEYQQLTIICKYALYTMLTIFGPVKILYLVGFIDCFTQRVFVGIVCDIGLCVLLRLIDSNWL